MEISYLAKEIIFCGLILYFVGSLFYSFVIEDKMPVKKA